MKNLIRYYIALIGFGARMMFMKVFMPSKHKQTVLALKDIEDAFDAAMQRQRDTEFHDISFPSEVYALFTEGGGITDWGEHREHNEGTFVVHQSDDDETYVLFFDNLDDAMEIADSYKEETQDECTIRRTKVQCLKDDQNVRFYHMNGNVYDVSRNNFLKLVKD
jgi:hypothetical protein